MDCRQVLERGMAMFSIATVCILVTLILIQFIVVYFSVQIGKRRGRALNDGANGRQTTIITSHPMNSG
jgi:hypothetical protein